MKANLATEVSLETNFSVIACRVLHTLHSSARSAGIEGGGPQSLDGRGGERRPRGGRAWPTDACRPRRRQRPGVQRPRSLARTWKSGCAERQICRDLGGRPSIARRQRGREATQGLAGLANGRLPPQASTGGGRAATAFPAINLETWLG